MLNKAYTFYNNMYSRYLYLFVSIDILSIYISIKLFILFIEAWGIPFMCQLVTLTLILIVIFTTVKRIIVMVSSKYFIWFSNYLKMLKSYKETYKYWILMFDVSSLISAYLYYWVVFDIFTLKMSFFIQLLILSISLSILFFILIRILTLIYNELF